MSARRCQQHLRRRPGLPRRFRLGVPIAVLPCVADALAAHPAYQESLIRLRGMGVRFGEPYSGEPDEDGRRPGFGWERGLDLLERRR